MAQHPLTIKPGLGRDVLADIGMAMVAQATMQAGPTRPLVTYPYQLVVDTTEGLMLQRSGDNSTWHEIGPVNTARWGLGGGGGGGGGIDADAVRMLVAAWAQEGNPAKIPADKIPQLTYASLSGLPILARIAATGMASDLIGVVPNANLPSDLVRRAALDSEISRLDNGLSGEIQRAATVLSDVDSLTADVTWETPDRAEAAWAKFAPGSDVQTKFAAGMLDQAAIGMIIPDNIWITSASASVGDLILMRIATTGIPVNYGIKRGDAEPHFTDPITRLRSRIFTAGLLFTNGGFNYYYVWVMRETLTVEARKRTRRFFTAYYGDVQGPLRSAVTANAEAITHLDTIRQGQGQAAWLFTDGTTDPINSFHPTTIQRLFGDISTTATKRTDIRILLTGIIKGFNSLTQLTRVTLDGIEVRDGDTALQKGEFIGNEIQLGGSNIENGRFALICTLTNRDVQNLLNNGPSNGQNAFQVEFNITGVDSPWTLNIPYPTATEATAAPIQPFIPVENLKGKIPIDDGTQGTLPVTRVSGNIVGNRSFVVVPIRMTRGTVLGFNQYYFAQTDQMAQLFFRITRSELTAIAPSTSRGVTRLDPGAMNIAWENGSFETQSVVNTIDFTQDEVEFTLEGVLTGHLAQVGTIHTMYFIQSSESWPRVPTSLIGGTYEALPTIARWLNAVKLNRTTTDRGKFLAIAKNNQNGLELVDALATGGGVQDFQDMSQALGNYTYNNSFGITKGQIHVGEASGVLRLSVALKDGDTLAAEYLEPGVFITYRGDLRWQVMRLISNSPPTITFAVRDLGNDPAAITALGNTAHPLGFARGIALRTLTLENRVDVTERQHFNPTQEAILDVIKNPRTSSDGGSYFRIDPDNEDAIITQDFLSLRDSMFTSADKIINLFMRGRSAADRGKALVISPTNENRGALATIPTTADIDNRLEGFGGVSWLFTDGTTEQISRVHPTLVSRLLGPTSGAGITLSAKRTDVRFLLTGFIAGLTGLSQLTSVSLDGVIVRTGTAALEKGEFIGGNVTGTDGAPGHFALICTLSNADWTNLKNNGPSSGQAAFQVTFTIGGATNLWTLRIPYLSTTEAAAAPATPHIPIEAVKRGIDIDQVRLSYGTATVVGDNHVISTRLDLNSDRTQAATGNIVIPLAEATVADGGITTPKLADSAVTTGKLATAAVSLTKIAPEVTTAFNTIKVARLPTTGINENATYFQMGNGVAGTAAPGLYVRHSGAWVIVSRRKVRIGTFTKSAALTSNFESTSITLPVMDDDDCVVLNMIVSTLNSPIDYCIPWYRFKTLPRAVVGDGGSAANSYHIANHLNSEPDISIGITSARLLLIGTSDPSNRVTNTNLVVSRH